MPYRVFEGVPDHVGALLVNNHSLSVLLDLYQEIQTSGSKRAKEKKQMDVLLYSAIIMMVASWEAFVENTAVNAFDALITKAKSPKDFPKKVLTLIASSVKESRHEHRVFDLAGDEWRKVFREYRDEVLSKHIGRFNTPKADNVKALFRDLLGIEDITRHWQWDDYDPKTILEAVDDLVSDRCEIAHTARLEAALDLRKVHFYSITIFHVSAITSNRVMEYVKNLTGAAPWALVRFGKAM